MRWILFRARKWILLGVLINIVLWSIVNFYPFSRLNRLHFAPQALKRPTREVIWTKASIASFIAGEAVKNNLNPVQVLRIAICESRLDPLATNKKSSARGLMQITLATQAEVEKNTRKKYDVWKPEDNLEMAFYFVKKNRWNRWECK